MNNMPVNIHGKKYITVSERVEEAHKDLKELSITTEIIPNGGSVVVRATVTTPKGTYTGISAANPAKAIEKQNPYEVAETSAVGRALGFAGYGIIEGIASADEMAKVVTHQTPTGVLKTTTDEEPPLPTEEMPKDKKVCSAHDEPIVMLKGTSKTKTNADGTPKTFYWHKDNDKMCFGSGYMD
jgi:hypothetical protein